MIKRVFKSKWFRITLLVGVAVAYLYLSGAYIVITGKAESWINELRVRFGKELTFEEALQDQTTKDWDFETDQVTANVIGTDPENGTLTLSFVWPPEFINSKFGEERPVPDQTVKITCPEEESDLYATRVPKDQQTLSPMETELLESGINIVSTAQSGDSLIGFCINQECTEISRGCELRRTILVEE
ncbi:hypothetical protein A3J33_02290 [candidate division WWE3 bacterium RIFCSPLOWO2_02_FULL_53_10]|uniref:Uncharacterized protein n=2 Tax=Katanobacteria TaxID=422282 RepID=A0A1F4WBK9_UNCKA|nr:MAG: hypothetical protein A2890_00610 [candidate division WWE3 bacterium RIFCSPLOWO2_01_FULL_53_14]OGC66720.1 MAG: hypothetical protein A3J33_02290 [candidate division WWE3 bacterium RIFCSPLOWO2_02_FULL_53_10]